ncbi:hypothetical protein K437DRAFT_256786 [Tilletiaria anomala UBC 951]|uniref:GDP/GTP exchange factor Sec2 N-terminal domain-containing protein n=1 Tax=Tilletiaria anomala (strain ATCC 24038 / CBS 436.72 / UBC 951) TaxID=1037660 RepID=A0A066VXC1_TILAU|nr:uncharacterized protein K437DRAFT_256786 [Tilletiaria anomala UBC 951]KDN44923.1 hypothetical protein K437DRAFT_256786 [Tilletiaria anomala UBC 951]
MSSEEPKSTQNGGDNGDREQEELVPSSFKRPDPDVVLNDEGNPEHLLGAESDAETDDAEATARKRLSDALELTSEPMASTQYATPKPNRASAVFTAGSGDATSEPQEDPKEVIEALQAQIKDLTAQVTGLNGKLVGSFERVADLEDDFSEAQRRLDSQTSKISSLEKEREEHLAALNTGLLVEKSHVSTEMQRMMDRVIEETAQRGKAESDKKRIEEELDELSASLFDEANRMVAVEKLARARAEEKAEAMQKSLKDTEGVMLEQQKVLASLQRQIEEQQQHAAISDNASTKSGADSGLKIESLARSPSQRTQYPSRASGTKRGMTPTMQVLINVQPYREFASFLHHIRKLRLQLKPFYSYPLPGLSRSTTPASSVSDPSSGGVHVSPSPSQSSLSPFAIAGIGRHRDYPTLPSSAEDFVRLSNQLSLPFIKRSQEEDTEPCLRLDVAPGLNWLSRRQANTAILEGNLVVEPIFPGGIVPDADEVRARNAHMPPAACALCGTQVVNVPVGSNGSSDATSSGGVNSDQQHKHSSISSSTASWANSISAVTGSAASSMLEAAGVRDRDRKHGAEKSGAGGGSGAASTSHGDTGAATTAGEGSATTRSRTGLFSGLRLASASPKPERAGASIAQRLPGLPGLGLGSSSETDDVNPSLTPKATFIPPIPTHIFRLSDNANARYLLCPHHCLDRLRAVCAFWGWLRALERSIILEGRTPWDEYPITGTAEPPTRQASSNFDHISFEDKDLAPNADTLTESIAVSVLEERVAKDEEEGKKSAEEGDAEKRNAYGEVQGGQTVDAVSEEVNNSETIKEKSDTSPLEPPVAPAETATTPATQPPPIPARRRPVPPPPGGAVDSKIANIEPVPRVTPTPPPASLLIARSVIPVEGGDDLNWEERLWQEAIKLKDDMYRARMGFREVTTA